MLTTARFRCWLRRSNWGNQWCLKLRVAQANLKGPWMRAYFLSIHFERQFRSKMGKKSRSRSAPTVCAADRSS